MATEYSEGVPEGIYIYISYSAWHTRYGVHQFVIRDRAWSTPLR